MHIFYIFISAIISYFVFTILFKRLNTSDLKLFVPLQKFVNKSKRKKTWKNIAYIFLILVYCSLLDSFNITPIVSGIIISFFTCLHEITFSNSITTK
ncbi:hypothetical protein CPJCM30710_15140 [Clostridium polyendosporum]|uniref:Uncharacterized protein n=1 Tax=Clostridium polyendosporum TaxID=69208 RepID=A0A919VLR3_9CLOT|nr:hypothetical protein CPJCM30710_15140 [Clostridium polyendosporum]